MEGVTSDPNVAAIKKKRKLGAVNESMEVIDVDLKSKKPKQSNGADDEYGASTNQDNIDAEDRYGLDNESEIEQEYSEQEEEEYYDSANETTQNKKNKIQSQTPYRHNKATKNDSKSSDDDGLEEIEDGYEEVGEGYLSDEVESSDEFESEEDQEAVDEEEEEDEDDEGEGEDQDDDDDDDDDDDQEEEDDDEDEDEEEGIENEELG